MDLAAQERRFRDVGFFVLEGVVPEPDLRALNAGPRDGDDASALISPMHYATDGWVGYRVAFQCTPWRASDDHVRNR